MGLMDPKPLATYIFLGLGINADSRERSVPASSIHSPVILEIPNLNELLTH